MFAIDSLVLDLVYGQNAQLTPETLIDALGGEELAKTRLVVDPDLDAPQYEMEISPTVPLRRRGERRLLIVDETVAPLRANPRQDPIVAKDLRPERDRLVNLVDKTGARFGRLSAFGTWGDAVVVVRSLADLRGLALLGWALDPQTDLEGRRRATPLTQKEFEEKILTFDKRLDELDDPTVLSRIAPARLSRQGELLIVDLLSDRDGSWDIRKSYELERRLGAYELFARIPGARQPTSLAPSVEGAVLGADAPPPAAAPPAPAAPPPAAAAASPASRAERPTVETEPTVPLAVAEAEPPAPVGPPISAVEQGDRVILRIPSGRFDLDLASALGRKNVDVLTSQDQVAGRLRDRIHERGCGFVAPLAFLSEVFLEGKPLDRRTFESQATELSPGVRVLEAHLPRFGPVRVVEQGGKRYVTSELSVGASELAGLLDGLI